MSKATTSGSFRTIFLSDLHLGSFRCDARTLADCLAGCRADTVVLVGDVFDFWSLRVGAVWTSKHAAVMHRLVRMAHEGTRLVLIPGNHDDELGRFLDLPLGRMEIRREWFHETLDGARYLVTHGHEQDVTLGGCGRLARHASAWRERLGALAHPVGRAARQYSRLRLCDRPAGGNWRQRAWQSLRCSMAGIGALEQRIATDARNRGFDGVICGHTHIAADRNIAGVRYLNCGDWIKSCTGIFETWSGQLELRHWGEGRPNEVRRGYGTRPAWARLTGAAARSQPGTAPLWPT